MFRGELSGNPASLRGPKGTGMDDEVRDRLQAIESHVNSIRWKVGFFFWIFLISGILAGVGFFLSVITTLAIFGSG